jgi:hypothetical protein
MDRFSEPDHIHKIDKLDDSEEQRDLELEDLKNWKPIIVGD